MSRKGKGSSNTEQFGEDEKRKISEIHDIVTGLKDEIKVLKKELLETKQELKEIKDKNKKIKQSLNINIYKQDELEQYGRRENLRIYGVPETTSGRDDGENVIFKIAETLKINLKQYDIQRAHRLGKPKNKPRPIIVRFLSYKKRCEFLHAKSKLKEADIPNDIFITEDLTPLCIKLFYYLKNECCNQFVMIHTYNGKIRMKKAAQQTDVESNSHNQDKGIGNWLTVTSPDDLFKFNIDIDFKKLNYNLLNFNIGL